MRMLIEMVVVLIMPFIFYGVWGFFAVRGGRRRSIWDRAPFKTLMVLGLSMVIGLIVWQSSYGKSTPYAKYYPAEVVDGEFVPGHFGKPEKPPEKPQK